MPVLAALEASAPTVLAGPGITVWLLARRRPGDVTTTLRTYAGVLPAQQREAAEKADALVASALARAHGGAPGRS